MKTKKMGHIRKIHINGQEWKYSTRKFNETDNSSISIGMPKLHNGYDWKVFKLDFQTLRKYFYDDGACDCGCMSDITAKPSFIKRFIIEMYNIQIE